MEATYISNNSFSVDGLRTDDFTAGRRLKLNCGVDGIKYAAVTTSVFTTVTTVTIDESVLTSNLEDVLYSPVKPGTQGNLPDHFHTNTEGDGGYISEPTYEFTGLTDTPATYSGADGLYAQVSGTQIIFAEGSDIKNFVDLEDTPNNYTGTVGYYASSTGSGIEFVSTAGLIDISYFEPTNTSDDSSVYPDKISMAYVTDTGKWPIAGELVTHKYTNGDLKQTLRGDGEYTSREYYDGIPAFTEEEVVPNLTSNTSNGHTLVSGPTWSSEVWHAFDSSLSNQWIAYPTPATSCWFTIELPEARRLSGYSITWNGSEGYPQTQEILGSNNGTDWTSLNLETGIVMVDEVLLRFDFSTLTQKYLHYKFVGTNPTNTNATQIRNFEFYGPSVAVQDSLISGWTEWADIVDLTGIGSDGPTTFSGLSDTPSTYSGTAGMYAQSTGSGIVWSEVTSSGGSGTSDVQTFLDLDDTPATYPSDGDYISILVDGTQLYEPITNYPLTLLLSTSAGTNNKDLTAFFDDLSYSVDGDSFSGTNGEAPSTDLWVVNNSSATGTAQINSNKLRITIPSTANDESIEVDTVFRFSGDFDIQVDYEEVSNDTPSTSVTYPAMFHISYYDGTFSEMATYHSSSASQRMMVSGTTTTYTSLTGIHYSTGKFRFTRIGTTIKAYYWSGSQWEWNGSTSGFTFSETNTDPVKIRMKTIADFDSGATTDFDNFIVNSGTVVWPDKHPNAKKISIQDSNGNQCYTAIEKWDLLNKEVILHTKVPLISVGSNEYKLFYDISMEDNVEYISYMHETLDKGFTEETFDGLDGAALNVYDWIVNYDLWSSADLDTSTVSIQNNKLELDNTDGTATKRANAITRGKLTGDFDIQIDWEADNTDEASIYLWKDVTSTDNRVYIGTDDTSANIRMNAAIGSTWDTEVETALSNGYGKFRLIRTGTSVEGKYQDGDGSWQTLTTMTWISDDCHIVLHGYWTSLVGTVTFDNLILNSGILLELGAAYRVWDSSYSAVYDFNQEPTSGADSMLDATINLNHGTARGTINSSKLVDAFVNKGIIFNESVEFIQVPDGVWDNLNSTVESLARIEPTAADGILIGKGSEGESVATNTLRFDWKTNAVRYDYEYSNGTNYASPVDESLTINPKDGNYHMLVARMFPDGHSMGVDTYFTTPMTGTGNTDSTAPTAIGPMNVLTDGVRTYSDFRGTVEFVRISNVVRSNSWSLATNLAYRDQLISYEFGQQTKYLSPNSLATALEFKTLGELRNQSFIDLIDTPNSYIGNDNKLLQTTTSGINFVNSIVADGRQQVILSSNTFGNYSLTMNSDTFTNYGLSINPLYSFSYKNYRFVEELGKLTVAHYGTGQSTVAGKVNSLAYKWSTSGDSYTVVSGVKDNIFGSNASLSFWYYVDFNTAWLPFIGKSSSSHSEWRCWLGDDGNFDLFGSVSAIWDLSSLSLSTDWHHFVITFDGTDAELFVDGVSQGTDNFTPGSATNAVFRINASGAITNFAEGAVDSIKIFEDILTANDISKLYNEIPCSDYLSVLSYDIHSNSNFTSEFINEKIYARTVQATNVVVTTSGGLDYELPPREIETFPTFTSLEDTPSTYSGGQYLRTTSSGIEAIDGIILKSPDFTEWLIGVTNSGTLTITEV